MADDDRYSDVSIYDAVDGVYHRLTWKALSDRQQAEIATLSKWARIASDLDRCEHGRHEGDVCSSCRGPSVGNRLIGHGPIGHTMNGEHIFSPARSVRHEPDEWIVSGGRCSTNNAGRCPINPCISGQ